MSGRIEDPWGARTPYGAGEEWPARGDVQLATGVAEDDVERWLPSASLLHSNGDALDIAVKNGRIVGVRGGWRIASTAAASTPRTCLAGRRTTALTA
jgi:hypothetical protein